jgi:hypothetical protein
VKVGGCSFKDNPAPIAFFTDSIPLAWLGDSALPKAFPRTKLASLRFARFEYVAAILAFQLHQSRRAPSANPIALRATELRLPFRVSHYKSLTATTTAKSSTCSAIAFDRVGGREKRATDTFSCFITHNAIITYPLSLINYNPEYVEMATRRIEQDAPLFNMAVAQ